MSRRLPRAVAALVLLGSPATTAVPGWASGGGFDAANLAGSCAAAELIIDIKGYDFYALPDIQLPRATTAVEEGRSTAIASPADPGDSVDALAGLGVPLVDNAVAGGLQQAFASAPPSLQVLPTTAGQLLLKNPFNPQLEYPWAHASAGYPNPRSPGEQNATLAGAPDARLSDPSGLFAVDAGSARAVAGNGFATADGGDGASVAAAGAPVRAGLLSVPALGISVGRTSAHSESRVLADRVTQETLCTLHDVRIAVPGNPPVQIGAVVAEARSERLLSGAGATATETITFSQVSVNGQAATLDGSGLSVAGHHLATLPRDASAALPGGGAAPTVAFSGTEVQRRQAGNRAALVATGATVVLTSTTPVPASLPTTPPGGPPSTGGPPPVSQAPTVYTLHLASVSTSAYALPGTATQSLGFGDLASGFAGVVSGGLDSVTAATAGSPGSTVSTPGRAGVPSTLAAIPVTPLQRAVILAVSSLVEALVLAWLGRTWLTNRRRVAPPLETTDLP